MAGALRQLSRPKKIIRKNAPLVGLVVVCFFIVIKIVVPATGQMSYGFIGRYTASRLLVQGQFGPQVYDDNWFAGQVQAATQTPFVEIFTPNLPTLSLLTLPFVGMTPQAARDSWIWLNLLTLVGSLGVLAALKARPSPGTGWALLLAVIAVTPALAANFRVGQVYTLLLFLFALTLFGLVTQREWLAGVVLGLALVLKTGGLLFWLLLVTHKKWRALGWGVATILLIVLGSLPWIGLETWLAYPRAVWNFSNRGAISVTAYQTTAGLFTHLFQFEPLWNPAPVVHWPVLAKVLTLVVTVGAVAVTLWVGRGEARLPTSFAALTSLNIILLPVAEEYHFVLLILPIFIVATCLLQHPPAPGLWVDWLLLGAALLLLVAPLPYEQFEWGGWWAMLAYPRLVAGWLIWWAAVGRAGQGRYCFCFWRNKI